jgi:hypothetical protein
VLQAGVQETANAEGSIFDGKVEMGPTQDQHPVCHSVYCFGVATSDPVQIQNCFVKYAHMMNNQEGSDMTEVDEVVRMSHKMKNWFG